MHQEILRQLSGITAEEQAILDGRTTIDRELYMQGSSVFPLDAEEVN